MTEAPTLKIHIKKLFIYFILLFQISCASLYSSNDTYNLRGKVSFTSDEANFFFNVVTQISKNNINIKFYDPTGIKLVTELNSYGGNWNTSNYDTRLVNFFKITPRELFYLASKECDKKIECSIFKEFIRDDVKILILLNDV